LLTTAATASQQSSNVANKIFNFHAQNISSLFLSFFTVSRACSNVCVKERGNECKATKKDLQ
jgi:hypothetical protein